MERVVIIVRNHSSIEAEYTNSMRNSEETKRFKNNRGLGVRSVFTRVYEDGLFGAATSSNGVLPAL